MGKILLVGEDAHLNERRAIANANRVWEPRGCSKKRTGREGERVCIDCVQSDVRGFGIVGDWKATVLEAGVWIETVTERGGKRRKTRLDVARRRGR